MTIRSVTVGPASASSSASSPLFSIVDYAGPDWVPPPCDDECACDCGCHSEAAGVRYLNGEVQVSEVDVSAGGFGSLLAHQRVYSNRMPLMPDFGQGPGWLVANFPFLLKDGNGNIVVVFTTHRSLWFDLSGGNFTGKFGSLYTLTHDTTNNVYLLATPRGELFKFHDFVQTTNPKGIFKSHMSPGGVVTSALGYNAQNRITELERSYTSGGITTYEHRPGFIEGSQERLQFLEGSPRLQQFLPPAARRQSLRRAVLR